MTKTLRLDKLLAHMGYGSRREITGLCRAGIVTVDGKSVKSSSHHVNPETMLIKVGNEVVRYREYVYLLMNKPAGVISATEDIRHQTVVDLLDDEYRKFDVFPVGRLDIDTEGFLLLTNDGQLAHKLLAPKKHVPKTYYAHIEGKVTEADVVAFKDGVTLDDGYETKPGKLTILKSDDISEIELTIYEGKFHQVKRMFEAVGKQVIYLKRIAMGGLKLDEDLQLGEYREMTPQELEAIAKND